MADKNQGTISVIQEGHIRKGGSNTAPTTSHPATSIQGFGPLPGTNGGLGQTSLGKISNQVTKN